MSDRIVSSAKVGNKSMTIVTAVYNDETVLIAVSYRTPIAVYFPAENKLIETSTRWSSTTTRHHSVFRKSVKYPGTTSVPQAEIDAILRAVYGSTSYHG